MSAEFQPCSPEDYAILGDEAFAPWLVAHHWFDLTGDVVDLPQMVPVEELGGSACLRMYENLGFFVDRRPNADYPEHHVSLLKVGKDPLRQTQTADPPGPMAPYFAFLDRLEGLGVPASFLDMQSMGEEETKDGARIVRLKRMVVQRVIREGGPDEVRPYPVATRRQRPEPPCAPGIDERGTGELRVSLKRQQVRYLDMDFKCDYEGLGNTEAACALLCDILLLDGVRKLQAFVQGNAALQFEEAKAIRPNLTQKADDVARVVTAMCFDSHLALSACKVTANCHGNMLTNPDLTVDPTPYIEPPKSALE